MSIPVLIEVTRGRLVESRHAGAVAVAAGDGPLFALGDVGRPVYPRSAIKLIQALPLVETGAADAYGFGDEELALANASHSADPRHVALALSMLQRAGLGPDALECGGHPPISEASNRTLILAGELPSALHNNCSGKHAGMLATACHCGEPHQGYVAPDHPVQVRVRRAIEEVTGEPLGAERIGIDGCSVPNWAISLEGLARGFARAASGAGLSSARAAACRRLMRAAMAHPHLVAGEGRFCTRIMRAVPGVVFAKTGAEGVYCGAIPDLGIGIALKVDDGAKRGAEAAFAEVVAGLCREFQTELQALARPPVHNVRGVVVGAVRPAPGLARALDTLARAAV